MQHNNLGDMGTISIMGALTTNRTLLKLNLNNNFITNDSCESIAQMMIVNDTLKVLRLKVISCHRKVLRSLTNEKASTT